MLQLYAELSDSERANQLFGRLEELYEDGHISISEYTDGLLAVIGTKDEHRSADGHSLSYSTTRTICDLRERLDTERREKEALRAETDTGVRFAEACARAGKELRARCAGLITFYPETQQLLAMASAWASTPFRDIGPTWSPILYQKALECEFNEGIWTPFRKDFTVPPSEFRHDRLTINQIKRLLIAHEPFVKGLREASCRRLRLTLGLSPALETALRRLVDHSTRARHGDRKPYTVADLDVCMGSISEGLAVLEIIALFHPR
jgi:hypothetical protein